jgi:HAE1 family hydrophobic/amphiphilic exporter-1
MGDIENIIIGQIDNKPITLSAVAKVSQIKGPSAIDRIQQARVAILSANVSGSGLGEVTERVLQQIENFPPPSGIDFEMGGQNEEMEKSFASLMFAIGLAIFLVYLVMAATFEHLGHPFVILTTIPLALVGVIWGLFITGYDISVISLIGIVFLVGIVVNNAIVLVDAINQNRRLGQDKLHATYNAACSRLRPILMTTSTTVLGLLPMAIGFGEGAELRAPLAVVVSSGLLFATALTLIVIPSAYLLMPSRVKTIAEEEVELERIKAAEEKESHHDLSASGENA